MRGATRVMMVVAAALFVAASAAAQEEYTVRHVTEHDGYSLHLQMNGRVELSDDGRSVVSIAPGGRLSIREELRGGRSRRAEFWSERGAVRSAYWSNGDRRELDAEGRAWVEATLEKVARNSAIGAERRVARLRERGGVPAVLRYVDDVESDGARRIYYRELLEGGVRAGEMSATLEHAARGVRSDGELRLVLSSALEHGLQGDREWVALLDAVRGLDSDGEAGLVLRDVARRQSLRSAAVRDAFFRAATGIRSDGERGLVLRAVLRREGVTPPVAVATLQNAEAIRSDGEKGLVLMAVPSGLLGDRAVAAAYERALQGIRSEGERERARAHLSRSRR